MSKTITYSKECTTGGDWERYYAGDIVEVHLKLNYICKDGRFNTINVSDGDDTGAGIWLPMSEGREKALKIYNKLINAEYISASLCNALGLTSWNDDF